MHAVETGGDHVCVLNTAVFGNVLNTTHLYFNTCIRYHLECIVPHSLLTQVICQLNIAILAWFNDCRLAIVIHQGILMLHQPSGIANDLAIRKLPKMILQQHLLAG